MKRIFINGSWVGGYVMGVQRYEINLLKAIDQYISDTGYNKLKISMIIPTDILKVPFKFKNIKIHRFGIGNQKNQYMNYLWIVYQYPFACSFFRRKGVDLTLGLPEKSTSIYALHDCIHEKFYLNPEYDAYVEKCKKIFKKEDTHIITVSEFSKKDLMDYYNVDSSRISIVYNGWDHMKNIQEDDSILNRLNLLPKEYCFSLGSKFKHKNIEWIYKTAKKNMNMKFVISGYDIEGYGNKTNDLKNIIHTGYISDGEVKALMRNCKVFLQPSLYEGFGIPPLEALSVGAEVISSNTTCLPEIYGDAVHYISPDSDGCIIDEVLAEKVNKPDEVLQRFTWHNAALQFLKVLEEYA